MLLGNSKVLAVLAFCTSVLSQDQFPISLETISLIPAIGFGTWRLDKSNASEAVSVALQTGYRHIDCAAIYGNEKQVGRGIKDGLETSGRGRQDIWITSKLWNEYHAPELVERALDKTLRDLKLDYLDLYLYASLIHFALYTMGNAWIRSSRAYLNQHCSSNSRTISNIIQHALAGVVSSGKLSDLLHRDLACNGTTP